MNRIEEYKKIDLILKRNDFADFKRTMIDASLYDYFFSKADESWFDFLLKENMFDFHKVKSSYFLEQYLIKIFKNTEKPGSVLRLIDSFDWSLKRSDFLWRLLLSTTEKDQADKYFIEKEPFLDLVRFYLSKNVLAFVRDNSLVLNVFVRIFEEQDYDLAIEFSRLLFSNQEDETLSYLVGGGKEYYFQETLERLELLDFPEEEVGKFVQYLKRELYTRLNSEIEDKDHFGKSFYVIGNCVKDIDMESGLSSYAETRFLAIFLRNILNKKIERILLLGTKEAKSSLFEHEYSFRFLNRLKFYFYTKYFDFFKDDAIKEVLDFNSILINYSDEYLDIVDKVFKENLIDNKQIKQYCDYYISKYGKGSKEENLRLVWGISSRLYMYLSKKQIDIIEDWYNVKYNSQSKWKLTPQDQAIGYTGIIDSGFSSDKSLYSNDVFSTKDPNLNLKNIDVVFDEDYFNNPTVSGTRVELKKDIEKRPIEYTKILDTFLFLEKKENIPSWVSAYFSALNDLEEKKLLELDLIKILSFSLGVIEENLDAKRAHKRGWFSWEDVFRDIERFARRIVVNYESVQFQNKIKNLIFSIISQLVTYENGKSFKQLQSYAYADNRNKKVVDLYHDAINSVQGSAFELLFYYIFNTNKKTEVEKEARDLIERFLENNNPIYNQSTYTVIAKYLPNIFYRDKEWTKKVMKQIYDLSSPRIFVASLMGQVLSNVYADYFPEMKEYYKYSLENFSGLSDSFVTNDGEKYYIKRFNNPEDSRSEGYAVALHISSAFFHGLIDKDDKLLQIVFKQSSVDIQQRFIDAITHRVRNKQGNERRNDVAVILKDLQGLIETSDKEKELSVMELFLNKNISEYIGVMDSIEIAKKLLNQANPRPGDANQLIDYVQVHSETHPKEVIELLSVGSKLFSVNQSTWRYKELKPILVDIKNKEGETEELKKLVNQLLGLETAHYFWDLKDIF